MGRPNCNGNVAGTGGRRKCNRDNVAGDTGLIRCDCECVFECLLALLAEAIEEDKKCCHHHNSRVSPNGGNIRNRCECVYECLFALLAEELD